MFCVSQETLGDHVRIRTSVEVGVALAPAARPRARGCEVRNSHEGEVARQEESTMKKK